MSSKIGCFFLVDESSEEPTKTICPPVEKNKPFRKSLKPTGADRGTDGETADDDSTRARLKTEIAYSDILISVSLFLQSILSFMGGCDCPPMFSLTKILHTRGF